MGSSPFAPPGALVPALLGLVNVVAGALASMPRQRFAASVRTRDARRAAAGAIALRVHTVDEADQPVLVATAYGTRDTNWEQFVATAGPIAVEDDHGTRYRLVADAAMHVTLPVGVSMRYLRTDAFEGGTRVYGFDLHPRKAFWISAVPSRAPEGSFRERPDGVLAPAEDLYAVAETQALLSGPKVPSPALVYGVLIGGFAAVTGLAMIEEQVWFAVVVLDVLALITFAIAGPIAAIRLAKRERRRPATY